MADETTFQPGDVVQLKSGSEKMTVSSTTIDTDGTYVTCFYASTAKPVDIIRDIPAVVLQKVEGSSGNGTEASGDAYTDAYPS